MTTRRTFLFLGALAAAIPSWVSPQVRSTRIGILSGGPSSSQRALVQALSEIGYRKGIEAVIESRHANDQLRYPALARQLVDAKCDLIFAFGGEIAIGALRQAGVVVPIVFLAVTFDPVEKGIISSLARPGGNMTGVFIPTHATAVKRLELASLIVPEARRFLVLSDGVTKDQLVAVRKAAESRGLKLTVVQHESQPYDIAAAFRSGRDAGAQGVIVLTSGAFVRARQSIASESQKHLLPVFGPLPLPEWLATYTVSENSYARRMAHIGGRILRGARAGDIPVEQPDEYDIMVNLRMAKLLGINIPYSVLVRATKIIE